MDIVVGKEARVYSAMAWRSYAKINLYLDVLGKRRDGYHNIETIFHSVSLADELTFLDDTHVSLSCSGAELDTGGSNLVLRAALLLKEATDYPRGARMHLEKRIPIAAGLAGGSGNAAATLIGLNKLWDLRLPLSRLMRYARQLGADVPYCLIGGTVAATLRGDCLCPLPAKQERWFILVHPAVAVSAGQVYGNPLLEHNSERPFAGRTPSFRRALRAFDKGDLATLVFNRMERPVFHGHGTFADIKAHLIELGCEAAAMSGSGPTLFGLCPSQQQALRVADGLKRRDVPHATSVVSSVPVGVERIQ